MIVLDTNVVSELMRPVPAPRVVAWVARQPGLEVYTTSVTLAEVRYGIAVLPVGRRRDSLATAAADVFDSYSDQILPIDAAAAHHYGDIVSERQQAGVPISGFDAQIAAICRSREASLATRNTSDFGGLRLSLVDPWTSKP